MAIRTIRPYRQAWAVTLITRIHKTEAPIVEAQTLTFTLEKETKNTIRYQEDASG